jgi:endonuclease YncB( thermonuclease family)
MHHVGTIRLVVLLAIAASLPLWHSASRAPRTQTTRFDFDRPIVGLAHVIDGDTIDVAGTRVRLDGIDAPESAQTCMMAAHSYRCGDTATRALADFIQEHDVRCEPTGHDRYGRTLARCRIADDNVNVNAWMVRQGWAVAYRHYSSAYIPEELLARAANRGLWAGTFQMPWDFRHETRERYVR